MESLMDLSNGEDETRDNVKQFKTFLSDNLKVNGRT